MLKPQDIYVVLKLIAVGGQRPAYAQLAAALGMSASEIHASIKRAVQCRLLHGKSLNHKPNRAALEEFLVHGLQYVFPAERGEMVRGVPTAYAAEPLRHLIVPDTEPVPVWPSPDGVVRGAAFLPLHKSAPAAAQQDPLFYEFLALADAMRAGRPRERKIAELKLRERLKSLDARSQPTTPA